MRITVLLVAVVAAMMVALALPKFAPRGFSEVRKSTQNQAFGWKHLIPGACYGSCHSYRGGREEQW